MKTDLAIFEGHKIRRSYDEETGKWYFSVVDIVQVLTQQPDFQAARNYWKVLKNRLKKEGSEAVTNCNRLKMPAEDGKMRFTDAADPETILRLVQSVPSPKAEPIKLWLAKVGYERMHEIADRIAAKMNKRLKIKNFGRNICRHSSLIPFCAFCDFLRLTKFFFRQNPGLHNA
ncbi:MAG: BRO family protein [Pyrinomonadaceae bacterium]